MCVNRNVGETRITTEKGAVWERKKHCRGEWRIVGYNGELWVRTRTSGRCRDLGRDEELWERQGIVGCLDKWSLVLLLTFLREQYPSHYGYTLVVYLGHHSIMPPSHLSGLWLLSQHLSVTLHVHAYHFKAMPLDSTWPHTSCSGHTATTTN